ncbi:MAG: helix-turn-helix domain-containing protein [Nitrospinales bacterium]
MSDKKLKCLMTQLEIAEASGLSQSSVHYILNGDRMPSIKTALKLERATGICREAWLFPERHYNPYIPFKNVQSCATCHNRPNRILKSIEMAEAYFEQAENKREAFKGVVEIHRTYTGVNWGVFVFREVVPEGLKLLACSDYPNGKPIPKLLPKDSFKHLYQLAINEETIVTPHFPYGIPESFAEELNLHFNLTLKSILLIASGDLLFSMYSDVVSLNWTQIGVKTCEKHIKKISKRWKKYKEKIIRSKN